jgi:hypothetical protein
MQPDMTHPFYTPIDYAACHRAVRQHRTNAMADRATRRLALRLIMVWAAIIAAVTAAVSIPATFNPCPECETRAVRVEDRGGTDRFVGGPSSQIQVLRARADALAEADPQRWWQGYGKTTTRSQAQAMADVARQIADLERIQAVPVETSGMQATVSSGGRWPIDTAKFFKAGANALPAPQPF